jgi:hypothetical protein
MRVRKHPAQSPGCYWYAPFPALADRQGVSTRFLAFSPPASPAFLLSADPPHSKTLSDPIPSSLQTACLVVAGAFAGAIAFGAVDVVALTTLARQSLIHEAPLGDVNLNCPSGMREPKNRGPSEKHSTLSLGLSRYADRIYIICTDECDMTVPEEFGDKVMVFDGYQLDECDALQAYDHWIKTSQSHLHAVTHAMTTDAEVILILEQDSTADPDYGWADGNWQQFDEALTANDWNIVRLGYRPLMYEYQPEIEACEPEACKCESVGELLCWLPNAGCDLRASDAYLLHKRAFQEYSNSLAGGAIIDNGVLQRLGNQLVVTPQVMHQTKASSDYTSLEQQKSVSALFTERCQIGMTRTEAAVAAEGLGDDEGSDFGNSDEAASLGLVGENRVAYQTGTVEIVTADGERLRANTAVEAFGGLEAFRKAKETRL